MATFYYDRFSSENINSQWTKHLQTNAYIRDIDGIVKKNRQELEATIQNSSSEQVKAIQQVCGKIDDGFAEVSYHLRSINTNISELRGEINEMAAIFDWKLSMLIEEQRLTNQLLGHIAKLLRIPDSQKQRVYFIEQGLKYLKNAILEDINSSFFSDALEGFKEAEKIERKDYITLNRIGQIHLYSKKYLDIPVAEEYFLKSARESYAEAIAGGTTTSLNLLPNGNQSTSYYDSQFPYEVEARLKKVCKEQGILTATKIIYDEFGWDLKKAKDYMDKLASQMKKSDSSANQNSNIALNNPFILATAESYLYASRACYLQQKLTEASAYAEKAYKLIPEFVEAGFEQAKYLAANNQENEAVKVLETVIEKDRFYSIKTMNDQDLSTKPAILKMLERLQQKVVTKAKTELEKCKGIMNPRSKARELIAEIEYHILKNNFISGMKALDILTVRHTLTYKDYKNSLGRQQDNNGNYSYDGLLLSPPQDVFSFINCENENLAEYKRRYRDNSVIGSIKEFLIGKEATLSELERQYWE
jgi:hypothetical protein